MDDLNYQINVIQDQCRKAFTFLCYYERDLAACEATYKEYFGEYLLANATLDVEYKEKIVLLNHYKHTEDIQAIKDLEESKATLYTLASLVNGTQSAGSGEFEAELRSLLSQVVNNTDFSRLNDKRLAKAEDAFVRGDVKALKECTKEDDNSSACPESVLDSLNKKVKAIREESLEIAKNINESHYREMLRTPDTRYTEEGRLFSIHEELKNNIELIDAELEQYN